MRAKDIRLNDVVHVPASPHNEAGYYRVESMNKDWPEGRVAIAFAGVDYAVLLFDKEELVHVYRKV